VQLVSLIFSSDDYCCTEESFAQTAGGDKALENPSAYAKNAVDYLNDIIQKKTRVEKFLRRENGLISLNPKYLD
jgi:hypothetical protein